MRSLTNLFSVSLKRIFAKGLPYGWVKPGHKYHRREWDSKNAKWRYFYHDEDDSPPETSDMVGFSWGPDGNLRASVAYGSKEKDILKKYAVGRKFDPDTKSWIIPPKNFMALQRELKSYLVTEKAMSQLRALGFKLEEDSDYSAPTSEPMPEEKPQKPITYDADGYPTAEYPIDDETKTKLFPEQIIDAQRVLQRWKDGHKGIILANGTGTGKTYVYAAAAKEWLKNGYKVVLIVPSRDLREQVDEALKHVGVDPTQIRTHTYTELSKGQLPDIDKGTILIFDEAHKIKNAFGGKQSKRGRNAIDTMTKAGFILFSSATPYQDLEEAKYLSFGGLTQGLKFDGWIQRYKYVIEKGWNDSKRYVFRGEPGDLRRAHEDLVRSGVLTKRIFQPDPSLVESDAPPIAISEEYQKLMDEVSERLTEAAEQSKYKGLIMAQRTNLLRAILERAKVEASIPLIREELAKGQSVAVFTQYKSSKTSEDFKLDDLLLETEEADSVSVEIKKALRGLDFKLPSPTRLLRDAFESSGYGVGLYTGDESLPQLRKAKADFNSGKIKLLVLTGAKGGTGLSFHDTVGNRPTTQFIMSYPYSAMELDQMLGRAIRKGLASKVSVKFPTSAASFERKLAGIIGAKMQSMGYTVRGDYSGIGADLLDAFEYGFANAKKGGLEEMLSKAPDLAPTQATPAPTPAPTPTPKPASAPKPTAAPELKDYSMDSITAAVPALADLAAEAASRPRPPTVIAPPKPVMPAVEKAAVDLFGQETEYAWQRKQRLKQEKQAARAQRPKSKPLNPPTPVRRKDNPDYAPLTYRVFDPESGTTRVVTTYRKKGKRPPRKAKPQEQLTLFDLLRQGLIEPPKRRRKANRGKLL